MIRTRTTRRKRHSRKSFLAGLEHLEARQVLDSSLVFNEVMYNPAGVEDAPLEWVEFYNQLTVDVDVSDWTLSGGLDYKFPADTFVPGKGYIVVAADPAAFKKATGRDALGPWTGSLNNAGEQLDLHNMDRRLMDSLDYGDQGEWPAAADGSGASLAKREFDTATDDPRNWTFSAEIGGTPGRINFVRPGTAVSEKVIASPAPVRALVAKNGDLGTTWTEPAFNDASWLSGKMGVGFASRASNYDALFGLDLDAPPNGQAPSPMLDTATSVYMRVPFDMPADRAFEGMTLRMRYDDGFVAYLNGTEIASAKAPGRGGNTDTLQWSSTATSSNSSAKAILFENFDVSKFSNLLRPGGNVLAIHGLNFAVTDSDLLFDAELVVQDNVAVLLPAPVLLNEVAAFDDANFFVEVKNVSGEPLPLAGHVLRTEDATAGRYVFGAQTLAPGQVLSIGKAALGLKVANDARLVLEGPDARILDGIQVDSKLRGRSSERKGMWQYPQAATPGAANEFSLREQVVISEIMYNPPPELGVADKPATYTRTNVVTMDWDKWRYNDTGARFSSGWQAQNYAVDGTSWKLGKGLIGYDTANLGVPFGTTLSPPTNNNPGFITYYLQTDFDMSAADLSAIDQLTISHIIDSGAVFYLNGQEILRYNLPSGTITPDTLSVASIADATRVGPLEVPKTALKAGKNTLSVELHLRSTAASDVAFGMELTSGKIAIPAVPGTPYRSRDEAEFIELYNKGDQPIDIGGWKLKNAVELEIPAGTILGTREHIVLAKDARALALLYPGARILGNYSGTLSNGSDQIILVDAKGNLADEVEYFGTQPWPTAADGGGSSLELRDVNADNNVAASWAASNESGRSQWTTHKFQGIAMRDAYNQAALFQEFIFGLLDAGEFLIDDIVVTRDPSSAAPRSLLQNGTFENDTLGKAPAKWRLIGTHSGIVETDPTNAANKVLHVTSTGAQAFVHDHAETTFVSGEKIVDGAEYSIAFRVKWLTGNRQLNSRLWFNRLGSTLQMNAPINPGTPAAANSTAVANAGPTFQQFTHSPAVPTATQEVTVRTRIGDPQSVASATLLWRLEGQAWNSVAMTQGPDGFHSGKIPAQPSNAVVQFYVTAVDGQGVSASFPAAGENSRALYQVADTRGPATPIDRVRLVMLKAEENKLFNQVNWQSNWLLPITMIYNDNAYYDAGLRFTGSRWIRPNSGYKVDLPAGQAMYGIHDSIRLDINGLAELVMKQMVNRAGGSLTSNYDDVAYLISPRHNTEFILQLGRYENDFLDEQFENGSDGTKWELDDVTVATSPVGGAEGLKQGTEVNQNADFGVSTAMVNQQGDNPEFYRGHVLIKSSRDQDNFSAIARFAKAIHLTGDALFKASNEVMDVDLWMRHYATQSYLGNWDTYGFARPKNLRIFQRPSDGKIIPFFWDCDLCNFTEGLKKVNEPTSRLDEIRDIPHNLRRYWGHMQDLVNRSFTEAYATRWATHYAALLNNNVAGGDETFQTIGPSTRARNVTVASTILREIPKVNFEITTNGGQDIQTDQAQLVLEGKGWVDVRQIRLAGTETALDDFWPTKDGWQVTLPLRPGQQTINLEAINYRGQLIATDSIKVTSTAIDPTLASLRLTEIQYNPAAPTAAEIAAGFANSNDFEYIELTNTGNVAISLATTELVRVVNGVDEQGVEFKFSEGSIQTLDPGKSVLVVENKDAFKARYGSNLPVAGEWSGGLSNTGERITVTVLGAKLHEVTYADTWQPTTDGTGRSLEIINPANPDLNSWNVASSWRASQQPLGSPGTTGAPRQPGDSNGDGIFNSADLVYVMQFGKYEDGIPKNATFEEGDWNGDGDFSTADFVYVFALGGYVSAATPAAQAALADLTPWLDPVLGRSSIANGSDTATAVPPAAAATGQKPAATTAAQAVDSIFGEWTEPRDSTEQGGEDE